MRLVFVGVVVDRVDLFSVNVAVYVDGARASTTAQLCNFMDASN